MPGRALVFGAVVGEIRGVENDVHAMSEFLAQRGFSVTTLDPRTEATHDAILRAYNKLVDDVEEGSDEPVVIYYAGAGGVLVNCRGNKNTVLPGLDRCIVPVDHAAGSETDFRGITSFELAALQNRLTARTRNVTVILDCGYGPIGRRAATEPQPRSLSAPMPLAMWLHDELLRSRYPELFARYGTSHPLAVCMMACGGNDTARPIVDAHGEWYGAFTLALLEVLHDFDGVAATWEEVGRAVAGLVQSWYPDQEPQIRGPRHRRIFALDELPAAATWIRRTGTTFSLGAGTLGGVVVGDIYAVSRCAAMGRDVARVRVTAVTPRGVDAVLIADSGSADEVRGDAIAFPCEPASPRRAVRIEPASPALAWRIRRALTGTRRLRPATDVDTSVLARLAMDDDRLRLIDRSGPLLPPLAFPDQLSQALEVADRLAAARDLLDLEGAHGIAAGELEISWGLVIDGKASRAFTHGAVLTLDDRIYLRIRNVSARNLFVQLFHIDAQGRISLVSGAAMTGVHLAPQQQIGFGNAPDDRRLVGLGLDWPDTLPRSAARLDTLVVIATTRATDLRMLETSPPAGGERPSQPRVPYAWIQAHRASSSATAISSEPYLMTSITYLIDPQLKMPLVVAAEIMASM